jgi:hypothetical protein
VYSLPATTDYRLCNFVTHRYYVAAKIHPEQKVLYWLTARAVVLLGPTVLQDFTKGSAVSKATYIVDGAHTFERTDKCEQRRFLFFLLGIVGKLGE